MNRALLDDGAASHRTASAAASRSLDLSLS
jgi:hypothetical protein